MQSMPYWQSKYSAPGPPSSQMPSEDRMHVSVQISASVVGDGEGSSDVDGPCSDGCDGEGGGGEGGGEGGGGEGGGGEGGGEGEGGGRGGGGSDS